MSSITFAWFQGVVLGLSIAAPFGPINVEIIRRHLGQGAAAGLLLGLGACSVDTGYILVISFGLVTAAPGARVAAWLMLAGAGVLAWLAGSILLSAAASARRAAGTEADLARPAHAWRHYLVGIVMTAASPMNLLFWLAVVASGQYLAETPLGPWPRIVGVMCGTIGWVCGLNVALLMGRRLVRSPLLAGVRPGLTTFLRRLLVAINVASAAILLGFSGLGAWRFYSLITSQ